MMDHPCVAKVFDAGSTKAGRPYFVMEHVPGVSITEHCLHVGYSRHPAHAPPNQSLRTGSTMLRTIRSAIRPTKTSE